MIEVPRGRKPVPEALTRLERAGVRACCCAVAWAEVLAGPRPGEEALTERFFADRGEVLIDATAGLLLWTLNRRDYPMADLRHYEPPV